MLFEMEDIVSINIAETFELLFDKNNNVAYKALRYCKRKVKKQIVFILIFAQEDLHYLPIMQNGIKITKLRNHCKYLKHITDVKPITARQCIKLLPIVAKQ